MYFIYHVLLYQSLKMLVDISLHFHNSSIWCYLNLIYALITEYFYIISFITQQACQIQLNNDLLYLKNTYYIYFTYCIK